MEGFFMPKTPTASFSDINLDFRPRSYFWPLDLRTHVLSSIRGAERRRYVERTFDEGRECELPADIIKSALHPEDRRPPVLRTRGSWAASICRISGAEK